MRAASADIYPWIHIGEVVRDLVDDVVKAMAETENDLEAKEQEDE
jgi:hypothetical protein